MAGQKDLAPATTLSASISRTRGWLAVGAVSKAEDVMLCCVTAAGKMSVC